MPVSLEEYREVAPKGTVEFLQRLAGRLEGRRFLHINATRYGGGVAEILTRLVPIMADLGIDANWEVIEGNPEFLAVTKAILHALRGREQVITDEMLEAYVACNEANAKKLPLDGDLVMIHDPEPAALIEHRPRDGRWVWRCHLDVSQPRRTIWTFLRRYAMKYDAAVFSLPKFTPRLPLPNFMVYPSIDPISEKNREMDRTEVGRVLDRLQIPRDQPILLQVARFDRSKDPLGVINAYRLVKKHNDCRLVLIGVEAPEDPESKALLADVREAAARDASIHVLELPPEAHIEINALQRAATIVLQKSVREEFALTVAEAMWKGKPVIGSGAGGMTVQIIPEVTGYIAHSTEGVAFRIRHLLRNRGIIGRMGVAGREHIRRNFLITRHLADYLTLLDYLTR
jgi:trehalose synthase